VQSLVPRLTAAFNARRPSRSILTGVVAQARKIREDTAKHLS